MYKWIKMYYEMGLYTDTQLDIFVNAKYITEEQKTELISSKFS